MSKFELLFAGLVSFCTDVEYISNVSAQLPAQNRGDIPAKFQSSKKALVHISVGMFYDLSLAKEYFHFKLFFTAKPN